MGGKALSANVAIRLTKANYERLASELRPNHIVKQYDLNKELGNGLR